MATSGISFTLKGGDRGNDLVRAGDFVVFVQRLLGTLAEIDTQLNDRVTRFYQFTSLNVSSAAATLHEVVDEKAFRRRHVLRDVEPAFADLVASICVKERPAWVSPDVLVKFRELAAPLNHVSHATIQTGPEAIVLNGDFRQKIDSVIGQDVTSFGEILGTLDAVNVHKAPFQAYLYPSRGEGRITCDFSSKQRDTVVAALGSRVRISGELKRRLDSERPYQVKIKEIERLPDDADLPLFESLFGLSKSFPDVDPVEYIRHLREADA